MAGECEKASVGDTAHDLLGRLEDETMNRAWGPDKSPEDRRRIVLAALIFGQKFDERMAENPPESLEDKHFQRFLMGIMNAVILEFAERESLEGDAATDFLSDAATRDYILEFDEVLDRLDAAPEMSLNEHLNSAVEARQHNAAWSDHWSSGYRG